MYNKVYIIGLGGVGSRLAPEIYRYLVTLPSPSEDRQPYGLYLIDGDMVELRNTLRQPFNEDHDGAFKAEVVASGLSTYYEADTRVRARAVNQFLSEENLDDLLTDNSVIFCCVDKKAPRIMLENWAKTKQNIVLIDGGNDFHDGQAQIMIVKDGQLLTCTLSEAFPNLLLPEIARKKKVSCDILVETDPQLLFANAMTAVSMLMLFWHWHEEKLVGEVAFYDLRTGSMRTDFVRTASKIKLGAKV